MVAPVPQASGGELEQRELRFQAAHLLLLGVLISCASCSRAAPDGRPAGNPAGIACSDPVLDAGEVYEGDLIPARFILENHGPLQRELEIETTCGCANLADPPKLIAAHDTAEVKFDVDTQGKGREGFANVAAYVHVKGQESVQLLVQAKVKPLLRTDIAMLQFGNVPSTEVVDRSFRIYQTGSRSPQLLRVEASPPIAMVDLDEYILDSRLNRKAWTVYVRIDGKRLAQDTKGSLSLVTNDPEATEKLAEVPFFAYKADGWEFIPSSLAFIVRSDGDKPIVKSALLRSRSGDELTDVRFLSESRFVNATIADDAPKGAKLITITLDPKLLPEGSTQSGATIVTALLGREESERVPLRVAFHRLKSKSTPSAEHAAQARE